MKFNIEISVPNNGRCRENSRWDGIVLNGSGDVQISYSDGTCWLIQIKKSYHDDHYPFELSSSLEI